MIGIYRMTSNNTPGIGDVIEAAGLAHLPEAHCYLMYNGRRLDYTTATSDIKRIESDILHEIEINSDQIGQYKMEVHQSFLNQWRQDQKSNLSLAELWDIREQCIVNLST